MSKKIRVKPSRAQSIVGMIGGGIFCFIGIGFVIPTLGAFGIFWTIMAVVITVINGINVFSKEGIATHSITIDEDVPQIKRQTTEKSIEERLEKLTSLYEQSLITEEEYTKKKAAILEEL